MKTQNSVKNSRVRFWCLLGLLLLLIMTRYALQIDIPRVLFLYVIVMLVALGDRHEIAAMCICCIPLHESIDFFYALMICICVYVLKGYKNLRIGSNLILVLVLVVWELLHGFQVTFSPMEFLSNVLPLVALAVLVASDTESLDYPFIVRAFAWTTLGVSLVLFVRVLYFAGFNILLAIGNLQRLGLDAQSNIQDVAITGGQINPNSLGIIAVLASTGLMQLRTMGTGKKGDLLLVCAMLVFAALGTSRTFLVCLALMFLLLVFSEKGGAKKKLKLILLLCAALAAATAVMAVCFPETFAYFVSRFSGSDLTTGRDKLMVQYSRFIRSNPGVMIWGIGLQNFVQRLLHVYRVAVNGPHNSLQEIVLAWGFPGLALFAALLFNLYYVASRRNRNLSLINWIPLIIILFKSVAGQLLTSPYTMLALSFAYLSLRADLSPLEQDVFNPKQKKALWFREKNKIYLRRRAKK